MSVDEPHPASSMHKSPQQSDMDFETLDISSLDVEVSTAKSDSSEKRSIPRHLSKSLLGKKGNSLTGFIKQQGENPTLETISLRQYSMPGRWNELLQFTSTCKYLWQLVLSRNVIGDAGLKLAESIRSWGENAPLKELVLIKCSMSERVWTEILQSLSSCNNLSLLDLSNNAIGEAGHHLTQLIKFWGDNMPLNKLFLENCSLPEKVCTELLQSLSSCKELSHLNLSDNKIGEAGNYLVQLVSSCGDKAPLQYLNLHHCSMPETVWVGLLKYLSSCKLLCGLNLSGNTLGQAGQYLEQLILNNPPMDLLDLSNCAIPKEFWPSLFQSLSYCKNVKNLHFSGNTITSCLSSFLPDLSPDLPSLKYLQLMSTAMDKTDVKHLSQFIRRNKLPNLKELCLEEDSWDGMELELKEMKKACVKQLSGDFKLFFNGEELTMERMKQEIEQVSSQLFERWDWSIDEIFLEFHFEK